MSNRAHISHHRTARAAYPHRFVLQPTAGITTQFILQTARGYLFSSQTASSDAFALKVTLFLSLGHLYSAYVPVITTPAHWSEGSSRIQAEESMGIKDKMDKWKQTIVHAHHTNYTVGGLTK